jgi:Domain of unknown function (DUF5618)
MEQKDIFLAHIAEARRYLANAKSTLRHSPIENDRYQDAKYVSEAAGIGYLAIFKAINGYLLTYKNYTKKELPQSIESLKREIATLPQPKKLMDFTNNIYDTLHIGAYYRELNFVPAVKAGFIEVGKLIDLVDSFAK